MFHIVNIDLWNKLNKEQQQIFRDGADMMIKKNREGGKKMLAEILAKLETEGKVKVTRLTKEERDAFQAAVQPVYAKFEKEVGNIPNKPEYGKFAGMSYLKMMQEKVKQYQ
jgi:TRAP-type C4-dicarboxylate transport system substrate-binding protein